MSSFALDSNKGTTNSNSNSDGQDLASVNPTNRLEVGAHGRAIVSPSRTVGTVGMGRARSCAAPGEIANNNHLNDAPTAPAPSTPAPVGKMIRKAPKDHLMCHRHSVTRGETEDQFLFGIATVKVHSPHSSPPELS